MGQPAGGFQRKIGRARAEIEHRLVPAQPELGDGTSAPTTIEPGAEQMVE